MLVARDNHFLLYNHTLHKPLLIDIIYIPNVDFVKDNKDPKDIKISLKYSKILSCNAFFIQRLNKLRFQL